MTMYWGHFPPRKPCPKIDCAQKFKGMTQCTLENGWAGYFFRVVNEGKVKVGDEVVLLSRPNPGLTIANFSGYLGTSGGTREFGGISDRSGEHGRTDATRIS